MSLKLVKYKNNFIIQDLNYFPTQNKPIMDFITIDIPITLKQRFGGLLVSIIIVLSLFFLWYFSKYRKDLKRKKMLKIKKDDEIKKINPDN